MSYLKITDIFFDFFFFSLGDEEYRFVFHIIVTLDEVSLVNDSFLKAVAIISVLYIAVAVYVIFRKPKEQEKKAASTNK